MDNYRSSPCNLVPDECLVLLVDDNQENRLVVASFLKSTDWVVEEARDGIEAIEKVSEKPFDLILMDLQMPRVDGYTATKEIRKLEQKLNRPWTPILALTAYALEDERLKSLDAGCDAHLTKPLSKQVLLSSIQKFIPSVEVVIDHDIQDLVPEFLRKRKQELEEIQLRLKQLDFVWIEHTAHKIAGVAGSYGFDQISLFGKDIEMAAIKKDYEGIQGVLWSYQKHLKRINVRIR